MKSNPKQSSINTIIRLKTFAKGVQVTISMHRKKKLVRWFRTIDEAMDSVLAKGDYDCEFYLNGYLCVLDGWVT
jgi:hypothetical protein